MTPRQEQGGAGREARWVWCPTCCDWIGAVPPLLPPYWSLDKAAGMHVHPVRRVPLADLLPKGVPGAA